MKGVMKKGAAEGVQWLTINVELVVFTGGFEENSSSSFGVVDSAQCRHHFLASLVHVHVAC